MTTEDDKLRRNLDAVDAALAEGNYQKACDLTRELQIPLDPGLAHAIKKVRGVEYLLSTGYNLSRAEAKYGKDWLTR